MIQVLALTIDGWSKLFQVRSNRKGCYPEDLKKAKAATEQYMDHKGGDRRKLTYLPIVVRPDEYSTAVCTFLRDGVGEVLYSMNMASAGQGRRMW